MSTVPFFGAPLTLFGLVTTFNVTFLDWSRINQRHVANVLSLLKAEMGNFGVREIQKAEVGVEVYQSSRYEIAAEIELVFHTANERESSRFE